MYRGQEGMFAWFLHRVSGLAVLLFLLLHILDTATAMWGREAYEFLAKGIYEQHWFRPFEVALAAGLFYHAINGLRVIVIDFWAGAINYQRQLWYAVLALSVVTVVPVAAIMMAPLVGWRVR